MFLITLYVGSSYTGLDLLLFQKLHQAQLLEEGRDVVEESPPGAIECASGAASESHRSTQSSTLNPTSPHFQQTSLTHPALGTHL